MYPDKKTAVAPLCTDFKSQCLIISGEVNYKVKPDGSTFILTNDLEIPVNGCPVPEKLAGLNFNLFLWKYRKVWPALAMMTIFAVLLQWCLWLIPDSPMTDMKLNFVALFSFWVNTILIVLASMSFLSWAVYYWFNGTFRLANPFEMLPEPVETGYSILPDIAIWSEEHESGKDFQTRVENAIKNLGTNYIVAIAFQHPIGVIIRKGKSLNSPYESEKFFREKPGFDMGENRKNFTTETYNEYREYLSRFFFAFPEYSKAKKMDEGDSVEKLFETI